MEMVLAVVVVSMMPMPKLMLYESSDVVYFPTYTLDRICIFYDQVNSVAHVAVAEFEG